MNLKVRDTKQALMCNHSCFLCFVTQEVSLQIFWPSQVRVSLTACFVHQQEHYLPAGVQTLPEITICWTDQK